MPRSSRHKSSKHSTREAKEYSDTDRESGLKERKGREDGGSGGRHLKDSTSGEKRKLESKSVDVSKDTVGLGNAEYIDGYGGGGGSGVVSSKKRKEKVEDDRWTGGDSKDEHVLSKSEMKREKEEGRGSGDSKRLSRREESGYDVEEGKRSGSKVDGKHHRSEKKDRGEKEGGSERERKGSRSDKSEKGERLVDIVSVSEHVGNEGSKKHGGSGEERVSKHGVGITDSTQELVRNPEHGRDNDRRVRRKRDGSGDGDRYQEVVRDLEDRRLSSKDEVTKYGKIKDDGQKDERNRDRFLDDLDKDTWHQDEKQRNDRSTRDHIGGRSDDKHLRIEKKDVDLSQKKSKPHSSEYDRELDRDNKERDKDREYDRDRGRERDGDRERSRHDHDRDREHEPDRDRDHELDWDRERRDRYRRDRDRDRVHDHDNDRGREKDFDQDHDIASHVDEKGSRYIDDRGRRRSPDAYDSYHGDKVRRVESDADKDRSLLWKPNVDGVASSSRHRNSPSSRAYADRFRDGMQDESKYGDSPRDGTLPEALDRTPKYRSGEKRAKFDDNHIGEISERSPHTKASPAAFRERSPSTFDRNRFPARSSRRRSLDVDETERRSSGSNDLRDISVTEDRQKRDYSAKKPIGDEYPSVDSSSYHKSGQGNVSSHGPGPGPSPSPGPSVFRSGADSPFIGSFGEDNRGHSGSRYRRSVDPNLGRGPGSAWKGVPNWPSPLPNGFMPFPPGPPGPHHGGFPPLLSQFPPIYGVRPSLDMNHPGMPYHMGDGDRFPGHVRPMGWNMVDASVPHHFHGWDGGNGILRDEPSMYGPGHLANAQRRDLSADIWKQNGDVNGDVISGSQKDGLAMRASADEASSAQGASRPYVESSCVDDQGTSLKKDTSSVLSPVKDSPMTPAKVTTEKTPESSTVDDTAQSLRAYLAKLDISIDLADPDLYNQFIDLDVKGQSEYIEDVELDYKEDKAIMDSEITKLTVDVKLFPLAKDSIFQRAMELYKAQSTDKSSCVELNGGKLGTPSSQPEVEHTALSDEKVESPVDGSVKQEEQTLAVPEEIIPLTIEEEGKEHGCTGSEILNGRPLESSEMALDVVDEGQMPVLDVEGTEEDASVELVPENVDKDILLAESAAPLTTDFNAEKDLINGDMIDSCESVPGEQLDVAVSSPLILCHASVKVCEPLISASSESESVILSRIHHAPESTH